MDIPDDCINVSSGSMAVSGVENEQGMNNIGAYYSLWYQFGWKPCNPFGGRCISVAPVYWTWLNVGLEKVNSTTAFSKWACNPQSQMDSSCSKFYGTCSYENLNTPVYSYYADYQGSVTATAWFSLVMPPNCVVEKEAEDAIIKLVGRIWVSCYSTIEYGVHIDEGNETCNTTFQCFNSNTLEIVNDDCSIFRMNCPYGCQNGICLTQEQQPEGEAEKQPQEPIPFLGVNIPYLSPFTIFIAVILGIAGYIEYKTKTKGMAFIGTVIVLLFVGSMVKIGNPPVSIIPIWIPILFTVVAGLVAFKFFKGD